MLDVNLMREGWTCSPSRRRPLLPPVLALATGVLLAYNPAGGGLAAGLLALTGLGTRVGVRTGAVSLLALLLGVGLAIEEQTPQPDDLRHLPTGRLFRITGVVETMRTSPPEARYLRTSLRAQLETCTGNQGTRPVRGWVRVVIPGEPSALHPGDRFEALGTFRSLHPPGNPGELDRVALLARRNIHRSFHVGHRQALRSRGRARTVAATLARLRQHLGTGLTRWLAPSDAALARALFLGQTGPDLYETAAAFRGAGAAHLLAISGLHAGVLLATLGFLLHHLGCPRGITPPILVAALAAYCFLAGGRPPVVRTSLVTTGFLVARSLGRRPDGIDLLTLAAAVQLVCAPRLLFDPSFQLSYTATVGIVLHARNLANHLPGGHSRLPILRWLSGALAVSLAAWVFTAPLSLVHFGRLVLTAPLANLLLLPVFFLALPLTALLTGTAAVLPGVAPLLAAPTAFALTSLRQLAKGLDGLADLTLPGVSPGYASAALFALLLPSVLGGKPRTLLVGLAAACTLLLLPALQGPPPHGVALVFLDVGHGAAAVLHLPGGRALVIDPGSISIDSVGRRILLPYLRSTGVQTLVGVVVSHDDADHHNGLADLLQTHPDLRIWTTRSLQRDHPERIESWRQRGGRPLALAPGTILEVGSGVRLEVWSAPEGPDLADNDTSLVLAISWKNRTILLPGDIEETGVEHLLTCERLRPVNVLAAPHHGAQLTNLDRLLEATRPTHLVVSARAGFSDREGMLRATRAGVRIHTTWEDGAVTIHWRNKTLEVTSFR